MANTFKGYSVVLGNSADTAIYTCPAATTAIIVHCQAANIDGAAAVALNMDMYDSDITTAAALGSDIDIPTGAAINPIGGKLVLEASDELRAWAGDVSDIEVTIGILEIS